MLGAISKLGRRVARPLRELMLPHVLPAQDLMTLLMKPRNGAPWSAEERLRLHADLRSLARSLPLFAIFWLPGGGLLIAPLAWLLDRRFVKAKAADAPDPASSVAR